MAVKDKKVHKFLTALLCMTYSAGYIVLFTLNDEFWIPVVLLTVMLALSIFSHVKYYTSEDVETPAKIILIVQAAIVFCLVYFDKSTFEMLFLLLLIGDCVYAFGYKFSSLYTLILFSIYYPFNFLTYNSVMGFSYSEVVLRDIIVMVFVVTFLYLSKIQFMEKAKYNRILKERNKAFEQLKEYSQKIEEMAMYEERSRIAYMLHNSIGHKLAAINLSLQAKKAALIKTGKLEESDLYPIERQLRETIDLLRKTIENSNGFLGMCDVDELLDMLISNLQNNISIDLIKNTEITEDIPRHLNDLIYNVILESVTNALRHSKCSKVFIDVKTKNGFVLIKIHDNGIGFDNINYGFGISKLKENIENCGGEYTILGDNGCIVSAVISLEETK